MVSTSSIACSAFPSVVLFGGLIYVDYSMRRLNEQESTAASPRARPNIPFPCFDVMMGFEYTAAVGMLQEGTEDEGLRCIEAIRARYDGRKRSPFDEAECGHHSTDAICPSLCVE